MYAHTVCTYITQNTLHAHTHITLHAGTYVRTYTPHLPPRHCHKCHCLSIRCRHSQPQTWCQGSPGPLVPLTGWLERQSSEVDREQRQESTLAGCTSHNWLQTAETLANRNIQYFHIWSHKAPQIRKRAVQYTTHETNKEVWTTPPYSPGRLCWVPRQYYWNHLTFSPLQRMGCSHWDSAGVEGVNMIMHTVCIVYILY